MDKKEFIQNYVNNMKKIQEIILDFLENNATYEEFLRKFTISLNNEKIRENRNDLRLVLRIISHIAAYHYRTKGFFDKIGEILLLLKDEITSFYTQFEIYDIFEKCSPILVFLYENKFIEPNSESFERLFRLDGDSYKYFIPQFKSFFDHLELEKVKKEYSQMDIDLELFKSKQKIGENDSYICQLIRDDSVEEFIAFVNRSNLSLQNEKIKKSIFETNLDLIDDEEMTLIKYAAFFGSIQIFNYLRMNGVEMKPELWNFAIHSNKPEMIHLLEELHVEPEQRDFYECYFNAVEYHHNNIARYLHDNLMNIDDKFEKQFSEKLQFYNFSIFADEIQDDPDILTNVNKRKILFYELCENDCYTLVEYLLNNVEIDVNARIILNQYFFIQFFF
ncbi:hypothetical protein M9Y10_010087 [Tritrichomonas musculus]|uniref:DUF3447 domain-containing protein n=1 Tax=Tritrichomonas musculus TaxID=1915356 RepID=A0ABR2IQB5_9EUKA